MPNKIVTPTIVAKTATVILENQLVMGGLAYRAYESEFDKNVNGYKVGQTISVRRPAEFQVRIGATAVAQDVVEGVVPITVDQQIGVDFKFSSVDLTMNIGELSERVIKPAMIKIANKVDMDLMALYTKIPSWVNTTPGGSLNSFAKVMAGIQRLDEMSVPADMRALILSPADRASLAGNQTGLYIEKEASQAYKTGRIGEIAGADTYWSQNAPVLTTGSRTNGTVNGAGQAVTYSGAQANTYTQTFNVAGLGAAGTVKAGDTFTIANVFAVNPVTKQVLPYLKQFVATVDATADGAGAAALTISPPVIVSGAFQTVSAAPANGAAVTWVGSASTNYQQAIMAHKNAFALCMVPMVKPPGSVDCSRETYKGISVRVIPYYDGTNDVSNWRLDVLYGVSLINPFLATRLNG